MRRMNISPDWIVGILFLSFLGLVAFGIYEVQHLGFLTLTPADTDYKVVGTALALFGVFATAIATLIGAVYKYSTDRQAETRQLEAEQRLRQEAVVKALDLLEGRTGGESTETRRNGALFTLSSLGQHDLAIRLASIMLPKKQVDTETVAFVADKALEQGDDNLQAETISLLEGFADDKLITDRGGSLPDCLYLHKANLSGYVRTRVPIVLAKLLCANPLTTWKDQYWGQANSIIAALATFRKQERDRRNRANAGAILRVVLAAFPEKKGSIVDQSGDINLDQLRKEVEGITKAGTKAGEVIVDALTKWAGKPQPAKPSTSPSP